jgi:heavy metal translocating P-type ATPase
MSKGPTTDEPGPPNRGALARVLARRQTAIAALAVAGIAAHLVLRYGLHDPAAAVLPLYAVLVGGGLPLVFELLVKALRREFGSDLLAGIAIVTSVVQGQWLAGALVVLMLSGGEALESYAVRSASSVLGSLAKRTPSVAHRRLDARLEDIPLDQVQIGDAIAIFPHEISPVDGTVLEGHSVMDESYLTGEPYLMSKTTGATVFSGAINGDSILTIRADKLAVDSRYAKIMRVMEESEQKRPRMRRLGDQLGAFYTPVAVAIGLFAWIISGESVRFLAVMVVATPCPLLIAIPVAIIGSISLAAKRGIIVKNPAALELVDTCRTLIFDKTGTLTYGTPALTDQTVAEGFDADRVLAWAASLERYSKHPLASAIVQRAQESSLALVEAAEISERPGEGLRGVVDGTTVEITSRTLLAARGDAALAHLPEPSGGMECIVLVGGKFAAAYRFRDAPRREGAAFVSHLTPSHRFERVLLVSGDRESEVRYLAERVGIQHVYAGQSPEQKVAIVEEESRSARTIFVGDGINDAPALLVATVGVAMGQNSDITMEAADVVVMDSSLQRVDELLHIGHRMRAIALQSAVGGMALSIVGMIAATLGWLPPVAGAIAQEIIDVLAVVNALRVAFPPRALTDY